MRIPEAWRGKDGVEVVVRLKLPSRPAFERAQKVADLVGNHPTAGVYSLAAKEELKRSPEAGLAIFAAAAVAWPDDPNLLNSYAWEICTNKQLKTRDGALAVRLARHAVEITGRKQGYILDTLAEALLVAGQLDEAEKVNTETIAVGGADRSNRERSVRIAAARAKAVPAPPP